MALVAGAACEGASHDPCPPEDLLRCRAERVEDPELREKLAPLLDEAPGPRS